MLLGQLLAEISETADCTGKGLSTVRDCFEGWVEAFVALAGITA